ncbi:hypothetical protein WME76_36825 [Sorangium sp. So ce119]|uniref:hypothetical protein n=1 Tax=Sorangium sp. So ce119 TaxID=3133279 RepID=UPI003F5D80CD
MTTDGPDTTDMSAAPPSEAPEETASAEVDEGAEPTPDSGFRRLPWDLLIAVDLSGDAVATLPSEATEDFVAPEGTRIAALGASDRDAYVYLVVVAEPSLEVFVYAEGGEPLRVEAGVTTRVPSEGWFTVPAAGKVRVISALRPLSRDEIAEALDGRAPPVKVSTDETRMTDDLTAWEDEEEYPATD